MLYYSSVYSCKKPQYPHISAALQLLVATEILSIISTEIDSILAIFSTTVLYQMCRIRTVVRQFNGVFEYLFIFLAIWYIGFFSCDGSGVFLSALQLSVLLYCYEYPFLFVETLQL